jgi:hypothetical protein
MRTAGIFAAAALLLVSFRAHADPKAWTAAKAGLPADAKLVVGVDLAAIQKTQLFATYYPKLLEKADATKLIDEMKATCKIDPLAAMQGFVVATSSDQQDGAVYIALSGVDRTKLSSCLQVAAQRKADKVATSDRPDKQDKPDKPATPEKPDKPARPVKVSLKQDGNITEISDGNETTFFGWVGKDVLVVALHAQDRPSLVKWMGGKGALTRSELGKTIAKVNTSATMWGAGEAIKEIQDGVTVKGGYGAVKFSKGNLDANVHAVMGDAAQATTMATTAQKQLDEAKQGALLPPTMVAMLKAVTIAATSNEVVVTANVVEKDLLGVLDLALGLGGP